MSRRDQQGRAGRRNFQPGLSGATLEKRELLAAAVTHIAYGGHISAVRTTDLARFSVIVDGGGAVRTSPMAGGKIKIVVYGTGPNSVLSINPVANVPESKGLAHTFPVREAAAGAYMNVGEIDVKSGIIKQILGYTTANLSGPINISGTAAVDRIAFNSLLPGAAISTAGTLNTLDVTQSVNLSGGPGISVGGDLNWVSIGGDLNLSNGASIFVGRDLGLTPQVAKGTDTGGQGGFVGGNVVITSGSQFLITRSLQNTFLVNGNFAGASHVSVAFGASNFFIRGAVSA